MDYRLLCNLTESRRSIEQGERVKLRSNPCHNSTNSAEPIHPRNYFQGAELSSLRLETIFGLRFSMFFRGYNIYFERKHSDNSGTGFVSLHFGLERINLSRPYSLLSKLENDSQKFHDQIEEHFVKVGRPANSRGFTHVYPCQFVHNEPIAPFLRFSGAVAKILSRKKKQNEKFCLKKKLQHFFWAEKIFFSTVWFLVRIWEFPIQQLYRKFSNPYQKSNCWEKYFFRSEKML